MSGKDALIKSTDAYRIVKNDKLRGELGHAYLLLSDDETTLKDYLKIFARLIMCGEKDGYCGECRICHGIERENFVDAEFFPKEKDKILTEDIDALTLSTYVKPYEAERKLFVLCDGQTMNASAQNKLLKTLEEPPENVHILIGATGEYALLPTVKSRVKRLEIPRFSVETLMRTLKDECPNEKRLYAAAACADGALGKAAMLYGDEKFFKTLSYASDCITQMKSSREVLEFAVRFSSEKIVMTEFLSALEQLLRDMLVAAECNNPKAVMDATAFERLANSGYKTASLITALDAVNEARKRENFNANGNMLIEWLLFRLLEGKYRWQKL